MSKKRNTAAFKKARQGKGQGRNFPTRSFEQLVGEANRNALKPYIDAQVGLKAQDLQRHLYQLNEPVQTMVVAMEELLKEKLNVTDEEIVEKVCFVEDRATGHVKSESPAKKGDLLRVSVEAKSPNDKDFRPPQKIIINSLAVEPYKIGEKLETALLGAVPGETKEVTLDESKTETRITVNRISERPQKEEK